MNVTMTNAARWSYSAHNERDLLTYTNDTGKSIVVKSISVYLGTGSATFTDGDTVPGNGSPFEAKLSINGVYSDAVTVSNKVGRSGNDPYYPTRSDCILHTFDFSSRVEVSSSSTITVKIKRTGGSGNCICYDRDRGRTAVILYSGKPPAPSAPSSSNLNILSEKLYTPTVSLKDIVTSWSGATGCQYQALMYSSGEGSGWNYYSDGSWVDASLYSKIQFRLYNKTTNNDYETPSSDLSYSGSKTCTIKLNAPRTSYTASSTGGYTIGESVTVTSSSSTNPSSLSYTIGYSTNSGTSQSGTYGGNSVSHTLTNNTTKFRSKVSKTGYADSDYSSWTSAVPVYYEPRNMTSNGFTHSFKSDGSDITSSTVAIPGKTLVVSWSSFLTSKNLGRFNQVVIKVLDSSGNILLSVKDSNTPSTSGSSSIEVVPEWGGKTCKLRLECLCLYDSVEYGPQETAVFESEEFLVGGFPEISMIYPSTSEFYSCNNHVRLIFDVINPSYFSDRKINNVTVRVVTQSGVIDYNYNTQSKKYFMSTVSEKPEEIDSGTRVDFTLPETSEELNGVTLKVRCSNEFLNSEWCDVTLNYIDTARGLSSSGHIDSSGYVSPGRPLLESDMICIHDWTRDVLKGYSNFKSSAWKDADDNLPDQDSDGNYLVQKRPYYNRAGVIYLLKSVYDLVKVYSIPPESYRIDLDKIDIYNLDPELVQSSKPPFQESDNGKFTPTGNYFNYILYILKNML